MSSVLDTIFYIFLLASVYVQVFFFITFLENRKNIVIRKGKTKLARYEAVTIVVPSWNEGRTIYRTVRSLLNLNYPKDKLQIFLIDDGSTDGTWGIIQKFAKYPNVKIFRKKNGGKHTALNLGLKLLRTDYFGCLDADSLVHPESLARIMSYFQRDPEAMAVAPSVTIINPKNFLQSAQRAEYFMGVYIKKLLAFLGAINVTPGPLTIFRRRVFDELGPYRQAHNTEDMEIAYRMQKNHYKIEHCNDAYVYTNTPASVRKLYRQRLRWIYGFINNTLDYRSVIFNKKYGNFSLFTIPMGVISILSVAYLFVRLTYNFVDFLSSKILVAKTVGWEASYAMPSFDPFFISFNTFFFLVVSVYLLVVFAMLFGRRMTEDKWAFSLNTLYYFPVFSIIAPFWLFRAILNTILSRRPSWR